MIYIYTQLYSVYSTCYRQLVKGILPIKRTWSSANRADYIGSLGTGWFLFRIGGWWICGNKSFTPPKKIEAFRWKKKTTRFPRPKWHHVQRRNVGCVEHRRLVPAIFWRESGGFERKNTIRTWDFRGWSGWWYTYDTSHLFTYESWVRWMFDDNSGDNRCLMDDSGCH